jgi:hypothetical protein
MAGRESLVPEAMEAMGMVERYVAFQAVNRRLKTARFAAIHCQAALVGSEREALEVTG